MHPWSGWLLKCAQEAADTNFLSSEEANIHWLKPTVMYMEYLVHEPAGKTKADSLQSGSSPLGLSLRCYRNNGDVCFGFSSPFLNREVVLFVGEHFL